MPLVGDIATLETSSGAGKPPVRRQSQHSDFAKLAIMSNVTTPSSDDASSLELHAHLKDASLMPPPKTVLGRAISGDGSNKSLLAHSHSFSKDGVGVALTDTPVSTAPNSPQM